MHHHRQRMVLGRGFWTGYTIVAAVTALIAAYFGHQAIANWYLHNFYDDPPGWTWLLGAIPVIYFWLLAWAIITIAPPAKNFSADEEEYLPHFIFVHLFWPLPALWNLAFGGSKWWQTILKLIGVWIAIRVAGAFWDLQATLWWESARGPLFILFMAAYLLNWFFGWIVHHRGTGVGVDADTGDIIVYTVRLFNWKRPMLPWPVYHQQVLKSAKIDLKDLGRIIPLPFGMGSYVTTMRVSLEADPTFALQVHGMHMDQIDRIYAAAAAGVTRATALAKVNAADAEAAIRAERAGNQP